MLGAITEHTCQPDLWRRYLALLLDGMRAQCGLTPLPMAHPVQHFPADTLITTSERDAKRRTQSADESRASASPLPTGMNMLPSRVYVIAASGSGARSLAFCSERH